MRDETADRHPIPNKKVMVIGCGDIGTTTLIDALEKEEYIVIDREDDEIERFIDLVSHRPYANLAMDFPELILHDYGPKQKRNPRLRERVIKPSNKFRNQLCSCGSLKKAKKCCLR